MVTVEKILSYTVQVGECLEWTRCFNSDGYPRMGWKGKGNGKVHRILMQLLGHDVNDKVVRHRCDNPKCLNPDHLTLGTPLENVKDMDDRDRRYKLMTEEQVSCVRFLKESFPTMTQKDIGNLVGLDARRVSDILLGKRDQFGHILKSDR